MKTWMAFGALALAATATTAEAQMTSGGSLTLEGARTAIAAAEAKARQDGAGAAIAVVDAGGNLMALVRLDGTFAAGATVSTGKARTAALFQKPTAFFEDVVNKGRTAMTALPDFTPLQGGVPIVVGGRVVGAIGVSGARSAAHDTEIAEVGAKAVADAAVAVTYIDSKHVAAAFTKGQPLTETSDYKVHASRREGPGQAEVHVGETDVIHVLTGTATFVTGGTVVDGKTVATGEIRGAAIEGGETRELQPGDVVVVPKGVPHWFAKVPGPFTYYVVKVL